MTKDFVIGHIKDFNREKSKQRKENYRNFISAKCKKRGKRQ